MLVLESEFVAELVHVEQVLAVESMQFEIEGLEQQDEGEDHSEESIVERSAVDAVDMELDTEAVFQVDTAGLQVNNRLEHVPGAT
jgi:hypothetical protein